MDSDTKHFVIIFSTIVIGICISVLTLVGAWILRTSVDLENEIKRHEAGLPIDKCKCEKEEK